MGDAISGCGLICGTGRQITECPARASRGFDRMVCGTSTELQLFARAGVFGRRKRPEAFGGTVQTSLCSCGLKSSS